MTVRKTFLLTTAVVPMVLAAGATAVDVPLSAFSVKPAFASCNPCNPCAAACNPCNPCGAGGGGISACVVPRLQQAAKCNPCAVAKSACSPCNPCAAAACNPCNPCAAAACNPCNPCAAANPYNPCGGCNPCGAGGGVELTDAEAQAAYDCLLKEMAKAYGKSDNDLAVSFTSWRRYSKVPYVSATHGQRYVQNYANNAGRAYGLYENAGTLPEGTNLAKPSFSVNKVGKVALGPLFLMEKMGAGFSEASGDWRYSMIMPNGTLFGATKGKGSAKVEFCIGCHISVAPDQDSVMLLPEDYRVK